MDLLYQQNKTKPSKRPVVAFYDIEVEVYAKIKQRANGYVPKDSSKGEDDIRVKTETLQTRMGSLSPTTTSMISHYPFFATCFQKSGWYPTSRVS